jgi:hypothetical protein
MKKVPHPENAAKPCETEAELLPSAQQWSQRCMPAATNALLAASSELLRCQQHAIMIVAVSHL